ncbi:hypothetical protein Scep_008371 [Stephania cephalantha]|uniref:Uncharacterized protein n=1 Tax=Stephania cephalantha TaxID=152367 RepID=A0AAP0KDI4_9MAGN
MTGGGLGGVGALWMPRCRLGWGAGSPPLISRYDLAGKEGRLVGKDWEEGGRKIVHSMPKIWERKGGWLPAVVDGDNGATDGGRGDGGGEGGLKKRLYI